MQDQPVYDHSSENGTRFIVPASRCWATVLMPEDSEKWHSNQVGSQDGWYVFIMLPNGDVTGPFGGDLGVRSLLLPRKFSIQSTLDNKSVEFWEVPHSSAEKPHRPLPDAQGVYKVSDGVSRPVLLSKVEPPYTHAAHGANFNGTVSATVVVGEDGTIRDIKINNPPGFGLEENIIEALHQWKFKPGELDGKPVPVRATVDITFRNL